MLDNHLRPSKIHLETMYKLEVPSPILADILTHAEERLLPESALVSGGPACHSRALWDWCLPMFLSVHMLQQA